MKKLKYKAIALMIVAMLALCAVASCDDAVVENPDLPEGYGSLANESDNRDPWAVC